jgi:nucleotide-binding universal stress UspA family protein
MKKILVPTDFSTQAGIATEVAISLAKKANAELVLLHVIEQPGGDSFNVEGEASGAGHWEDKLFMLKLIEKAKGQLADAAAEAKRAGITVREELKLGNAYHGIHAIIADLMVSLVVMGTEGHSKLEQMIIGSNTEKVLRRATCPVLTVHKKPSSLNFRNIVYATSLDAAAEENFSLLIRQLQELYDATLHVVRINTPDNFQPDTVVKKVMQNFVTRMKLKNFTSNVFNDRSEEEGIIHFADSLNADLILMATHGRKGFMRVLAGSIAEEVVNHTQRPVLTFVTK